MSNYTTRTTDYDDGDLSSSRKRPLLPRKRLFRESVGRKESNAGKIASTSLVAKLAGDIVVGSAVTFAVAPFLTVVDKAIVQTAAGSHTLVQSGIESVQGIFRQPLNYVRSPTFLLMWGVYAATYSTANSLKTIMEHQESRNQPVHKPSKNGKLGVFFGTTFVNSGTSLMKDQAYAKMFGTKSTSLPIPGMSYAFWMMRDLSVIGSAFILPDLISCRVAQTFNIEEDSARSLSQISLPIVTQVVAGPLHYMGLDLYNRNLDSKAWFEAIVDRMESLRRGFSAVVTARIARIAPGYGIGGVLNTKFRNRWRESLVEIEGVERTEAVKSREKSPSLLSQRQIVKQ